MKCDTCKNQKHDSYAQGSEDYCSVGNWFGLGDTRKPVDETLWDDCEDYKPLEGKK